MYERIRTYLSEQLDIPAEEMSRETTFESLHLDSLDMVEELGVDFEMEGEMKLETLGDLADFIEDKLAEME